MTITSFRAKSAGLPGKGRAKRAGSTPREARAADGASMRIGRAKFRAVAVAADDASSGEDDKARQILRARQRAVDNAIAACAALDRSLLDGCEIRVERARPVDMKEYTRYGDY